MLRRIAITLLFLMQVLSAITVDAQNNDTVRLYFKLDIDALDRNTRNTVDSLLYNDIVSSSDKLLIVGYTDYIGTNEYNNDLSIRRAQNVKSYLLNMGVNSNDITLLTGKGEIERNIELPDGYASDRRVDIVRIMKPPTQRPTVKNKITKTQTIKSAHQYEPISFNSSSDLDISNIPIGQRLVLDRIFFYTGRHMITSESMPELHRLFQLLDENITLKIKIEGHVCCVDPTVDALDIDTKEQALSVNRAKFIYLYLIERGIEKERLSYEGFGKSRPLRPREFTQEDQDMNKRVEFRIVDK
ncbi:MAG: OmpA family protein [Chitinophagaceae bacterium]|nr:OmpA family protein [Chitinophagaceae bacterium]